MTRFLKLTLAAVAFVGGFWLSGCATREPAPVRQGPIEIELNLSLDTPEGPAREGLVTNLLANQAAFADDERLDQTKGDGLLGEKHTGYLGLLSQDISPSLRRQIQEINAKRRAHYQALAAETGTTLDQIAQLAGEKLIASAMPGTYVMTALGGWTMIDHGTEEP